MDVVRDRESRRIAGSSRCARPRLRRRPSLSYSRWLKNYPDLAIARLRARVAVRIFTAYRLALFEHALEERDGRRGHCPVRQGPSGARAPGKLAKRPASG